MYGEVIKKKDWINHIEWNLKLEMVAIWWCLMMISSGHMIQQQKQKHTWDVITVCDPSIHRHASMMAIVILESKEKNTVEKW